MRTRSAIVLVLTVAFAAILPVARAGAGGFCMGYTNAESFTDTDGDGVSMHDNCFSPTVVRIEAGDTVTFVNKDEEVHAVGGAVGSFGDAHAEIRPGDSVRYRFDVEGTFPYVCVYHPGMAGAVVVGDGEGPAFEAGGIAPVTSDEDSTSGSSATEENVAPIGSTVDESDGFPWLETLTVALAVALALALIFGAFRRSRGAETKPV
jgi:plastocyanin